MKTKPVKKTSAVSVICFILAVIFFLYGIYMVLYSVDYIRSYESTGLINTQNALQYVITSSASYFGFAFLLFAAGYAIRMLKKMQPAYSGVISEDAEEMPAPEIHPAETPEVKVPEAESHVPEIGDTSSALTFHELIIDAPEAEPAAEKPAVEEPADVLEELQEEPAAVPEEEPAVEETVEDEAPAEEAAESPKKPAEPEKISSSMIRDIFEQK